MVLRSILFKSTLIPFLLSLGSIFLSTKENLLRTSNKEATIEEMKRIEAEVQLQIQGLKQILNEQ